MDEASDRAGDLPTSSAARRLAAVIEGMSEAFLSLDARWRITYANREACRLNRVAREALVGRDHWRQWPETVGTEVERQYRRVAAERVAVRFEHHYPAAAAWHSIHAYPAEDGGIDIFYRDVTPEKAAAVERERLLVAERQARADAERAAAELAAREARFRALIEHAADVITVVDARGVRLYTSPSYARVYGFAADESIGASVFDRVHPDDVERLVAAFRALLAKPGATETATYRVRHADGSWRDIRATAQNRLDDPAIGGVIINSVDVTEQVRAERALRESEQHYRHRALHDPLTGLANRALFGDRVAHALARAARQGTGVAVLYLDLDGFKRLNDTRGHAVGDLCLTTAAGYLTEAVRADDTVARLGGDEFAILLEGARPAHAESEAVGVARRIAAALREPIEAEGGPCTLAASIGIASDDGSSSPEALLDRADRAMYAAKARGGDRYEVATDS